MRYDIVKSDPAQGSALAVALPDGLLPLRSFRDFYAFEQHVKTARARRGLEMIPEWYDFPVFYFSNATNLLTHGDALLRPPYGEWLDYELEVGCVIGKECRNVAAADAEQYILGYCVVNDWSMRDTQREEMKMSLGPAKGKDFGTTVGPQLVSVAELEPRRSNKGFNCTMTTRVNGVELSRGNWDSISFSFAQMIERASAGVTLYPGEVLGSGTVGTGCILELGNENTAPLLKRGNGWLQVGDVVELEIDGLGVISNEIVAP